MPQAWTSGQHPPATHVSPAAQQMTPQTRAFGQHVAATRVSLPAQHLPLQRCPPSPHRVHPDPAHVHPSSQQRVPQSTEVGAQTHSPASQTSPPKQLEKKRQRPSRMSQMPVRHSPAGGWQRSWTGLLPQEPSTQKSSVQATPSSQSASPQHRPHSPPQPFWPLGQGAHSPPSQRPEQHWWGAAARHCLPSARQAQRPRRLHRPDQHCEPRLHRLPLTRQQVSRGPQKPEQH